jgi:hypothetical protein
MNCRNTIVWGWKTTRSMNSGKPAKIIASFPPSVNLSAAPPYIQKYIESSERCGGKIVANIDVGYVGNYEGEAMWEDAGVGIKFVCDRCKNTHFPELPKTIEDLNTFLTYAIEKKQKEKK